jgi:ABC-2 type transport system permease protein
MGAIIRKEVRQLRRDRLTFGMVFGLPIIQILLFGYAINTDVRNLHAAVADQANTSLSREFVADVEATQVVRFVDQAETPAELEAMLRRGDISIGVFIPPDFDRRVVDQTRSAVHVLVDGSDPTVLGVAAQLRNVPVQFGSGSQRQAVELIETRAYYNPERRTPVNIVPGLMGVILMGKVTPYVLIGLLQLGLILGVGRLLFDVPVRGSVLDLYIAGTAFIAAKLSLGLLISTAVRTQFQAMQMTVFILMPSILLSGFMFPFAGMPQVAQFIGEVLPTTHFIRLTRGIMLRDASLFELTPDFLYLVGFTVVAMTIAALRFTKRLD